MNYRNIVFAALLAAWLPFALSAQPQCSSQNLRGTWSYTMIGWAIPTAPGPWTIGQTLPIVGVGVAIIDHTGKMTGPGTIVMGGVVVDYEMTAGTVEVNSDCTGVMKYTLKLKGTPDLLPGYMEKLVLDLTRHEMVSVPVQSPISKPMWVTTTKRISPVPSPVTWP